MTTPRNRPQPTPSAKVVPLSEDPTACVPPGTVQEIPTPESLGWPEDYVQPEAGEIPPAPEMDPTLGDKTPAFVEWMRDHKPEEFATRYANRKTHITEKNED